MLARFIAEVPMKAPTFLLTITLCSGFLSVFVLCGCQTQERPGPPGSLDKSFAPVTANNSIYAVAIQPDGKVVIGGVFTSINGQPRWLLARVSPKGELDEEFKSGLTKEDLSMVSVLESQPDGSLLVGGDSGLFKLSKNGTPDKNFRIPVDGQIRNIVTEKDGHILVGGRFKNIGGQPRAGLARLKPDGSLDAFKLDALDSPKASSFVTAIEPANPSGYYLAGNFHLPGSESPVSLIKTTADGRLDTNFVAAVSGKISDLALQADGKLLVAGERLGSRKALARLLPSGGLDETFDAGVDVSEPGVSCVIAAPNGKILAAGVRFTGARTMPLAGFACLNSDGSLDSGFEMSKDATFYTGSMAAQPDGKIVLTSTTPPGGSFPPGLVRLNGPSSVQ